MLKPQNFFLGFFATALVVLQLQRSLSLLLLVKLLAFLTLPLSSLCSLVFITGATHMLLFSTELGEFMHACEGDLVCKCTNEKIPYFNAPVYLENKSQIGKVDDIFGPMSEFVSFQCYFFLTKVVSGCLCKVEVIPAGSFKRNAH